MTDLSTRLKQARMEKGLTQAELAKMAGIKTQSVIGNLEAGSRKTTSYLPQIAQVLGVSALWLATGKDGPDKINGKHPLDQYKTTFDCASIDVQKMILNLLASIEQTQGEAYEPNKPRSQPTGRRQVQQ